MLFRVFCVALLAAMTAAGADFGFQVIIRAGQNGAGDWEIGIGNNLNSPAATANVVPYWNNNAPRDFEVGYVASTNRAYVRVGNDMVSYYPVGGGALAPGGTWTLPASGFYVSTAGGLYSAVSVSNLSLSTGMSVLQGFSTTSLEASQFFFGSASENLPLPVVLGATASSSWVLTGQIAFAGWPAMPTGSQALFHLTAQASSEVPEPETFAMIGGGLLALAALGRNRRKNP